MISTTNSVILLICMGLFALRYYKQGVWKAFFGLLGIVSAYIVCILAAPSLANISGKSGLEGVVVYGVSTLGVFLLTSMFVSTVPLLIFPSLKHANLRQKMMGAGLGAIAGGALAIIVIWFVSAAGSMLGINKKSGTAEQDVLEKFSSSVVSKAVHSGIRSIEKDEYRASATAAFLSAPQVFSEAFAELSKSNALQQLWSDGSAQFYMAEGDVDQLLENESFRQFSQLPAMQKVLQEGKPKDVSVDDAERYLATQMSYVWRRMRDLRGDPRVAEILNDREVKALVAQQNPVALVANAKVQSLIDIVLEAPVDKVMPVKKNIQAKVEKQAQAVNPNIIYKWLDANGNMRYTDYDHTPESERETAEIIIQ